MKKLPVRLTGLILLGLLIFPFSPFIWAQNEEESDAKAPVSTPEPQQLVLKEAVTCEKVQDLEPVNEAIVFSVSVGQVCCFTAFEKITEPTVMYHRWFHRDEFIKTDRLRTYPPQWSTYSAIQLRDNDKGPWRVEITNKLGPEGVVFKTLRFSITD